jgi:DNA helicase-2/ATP-dependent DNA helicase PcrA
MQLTQNQQVAVDHLDGPLLVLAGPGSGKTSVIANRIVRLVERGIQPCNILAITFTNKAAEEMQKRVDQMIPIENVWIGTFHRFCTKMLRTYPAACSVDKDFTIYDQYDSVKAVKAILGDFDAGRAVPDARTVQEAISLAKNQFIPVEQYTSQADDDFKRVVADVYRTYEERMKIANSLDFDDLLLKFAIPLRNSEELRTELAARFRYILVDEYQDTNRVQYEIIKELTRSHRNICVVGDLDQSIYGWRGADVGNILQFEQDFPGTRVVTLSDNFRSTKSILEVANRLIAHNARRKEKTLVTTNPEGARPRLLRFDDQLDEASDVVNRIKTHASGVARHYSDYAIFVRTNALTRNVENELIRARVPYQIVRGLTFFERKEVKDVLAYLRLLVNECDDVSFSRAVNEPSRGVGKTTLERLRDYATAKKRSLLSSALYLEEIPDIKGRAAAGLRGFVDLIVALDAAKDLPVHEIVEHVLAASGYAAMLKKNDDERDRERLANVQELVSAAKQFSEEVPDGTLAAFLENATLASDVDEWDEVRDCVSIMTLHLAKGLEFPVVYILALEEGILPHEKSSASATDVEEERRLLFVGITRAKEELYVTFCRRRELFGQTRECTPSVFLGEMRKS